MLGLYDVPREALTEVREAGFDVVTGPADRKFLDAAAKAKLQVLVNSSAFSSDAAKVQEELGRFDRHPATWGWYLIDEPDLHDVPPQRVSEVARSFQARAQKPGVVVLSSGSAAKSYGSDCDLLLVDFYPIPWAPLSRFGKEMRLASFARNQEPYMAVLQAFDWTHFPEVLGQTNNLRAPTIAEVRCMAYLALALEAQGLFFYSYKAGTWNLASSALWPELKTLVQKIRSDSPLFKAPPLWWPTEVSYGDQSRMYNEVHDSVVLARLYYLAQPALGRPSGFYFLVMNTTGEKVRFDFRLPFSGTATLRRDNETLTLDEGWLRRDYAPFEVSIFGPVETSSSIREVRDGVFR